MAGIYMFVLWVFISDWYCLGIKTALMPVLSAKQFKKFSILQSINLVCYKHMI